MAQINVNVRYAGAVMIPWAPQEVHVNPDTRYRGKAVIDDYVSRAGVMGSYRVYLLDRETGEQVDRTVSGPDGRYQFHNLRIIPDGYTLVAVDNDPKIDALNAAVADLITPELL